MFTAAYIITLFSALGAAIPAPAHDGDQGVVKRFDPGWCTFHMHNDWSNALQANPTNKIAITMFDGSGNNFWNLTQTDIKGALPFSFQPDGFTDRMSINSGVNQGWEFTYKDDIWQTSDDSGRCSAGKLADPGSKGNGNRWTQDFDCGFTC